MDEEVHMCGMMGIVWVSAVGLRSDSRKHGRTVSHCLCVTFKWHLLLQPCTPFSVPLYLSENLVRACVPSTP